jgi:hypothetical protein
LHLLNELVFVQALALLSIGYLLLIVSEPGKAHLYIVEEVGGEHLTEQLDCRF